MGARVVWHVLCVRVRCEREEAAEPEVHRSLTSGGVRSRNRATGECGSTIASPQPTYTREYAYLSSGRSLGRGLPGKKREYFKSLNYLFIVEM
jgi:hypothetical protein